MAQAVPLKHAELTPEEWRLVSRLRDIPQSPLRERLAAVIDELVAMVRDPHCSEMQADGVPCLSVTTSCDQCQQVAALLGNVRRRLHQA